MLQSLRLDPIAPGSALGLETPSHAAPALEHYLGEWAGCSCLGRAYG